MSPSKIVLLACGSFNPPTNMHLRMFEIARDHLHRMGTHKVIGGIMSPVHDAYGKNDLESSSHRLEMVRLALKTSDWIRLSDWECNQESWSRTRQVLNHHQNEMCDVSQATLNGNYKKNNDEYNLNEKCNVGVKLLCGADLLESFGTPGLWADEDIECIVGKYGLVVITRNKLNPLEFIYNSDVLTKYMSNITIVTEWIGNEVSSTKIRRALRRNESVKYLIPDPVIDYIQRNELYGCKHNKYETELIFKEFTERTSFLNCMNICNSNLYKDKPKYYNIDTVDHVRKKKKSKISSSTSMNNKQRPGQAVQIRNVVKDDVRIDEKVRSLNKSTQIPHTTRHKSDSRGNINANEKYKSNNGCLLLDCKSCDDDLIKLIFRKHGIQIISDIEIFV